VEITPLNSNSEVVDCFFVCV